MRIAHFWAYSHVGCHPYLEPPPPFISRAAAAKSLGRSLLTDLQVCYSERDEDGYSCGGLGAGGRRARRHVLPQSEVRNYSRSFVHKLFAQCRSFNGIIMTATGAPTIDWTRLEETGTTQIGESTSRVIDTSARYNILLISCIYIQVIVAAGLHAGCQSAFHRLQAMKNWDWNTPLISLLFMQEYLSGQVIKAFDCGPKKSQVRISPVPPR